MSDNPFSEPDDSDRTVIRPAPGGRRPARRRRSLRRRNSLRRPARLRRARAAAPISAEGAETHQLRPQPADRRRRRRCCNCSAACATPTASPTPATCASARSSRCARSSRRPRDAGVPMEQLRPAHYALCASLDDVVLNTPWGSSGAWAARSLVSTFHQEVRSGERFFDAAGPAASRTPASSCRCWS